MRLLKSVKNFIIKTFPFFKSEPLIKGKIVICQHCGGRIKIVCPMRVEGDCCE